MISGERQQRGHITKAGNSRMRRLLVQVAVSILRLRSPRTQELRDWASRLTLRRGKKIATVALARRMAGVLYAMMRDGTHYAAAQPQAIQGRLNTERAIGNWSPDSKRLSKRKVGKRESVLGCK